MRNIFLEILVYFMIVLCFGFCKFRIMLLFVSILMKIKEIIFVYFIKFIEIGWSWVLVNGVDKCEVYIFFFYVEK